LAIGLLALSHTSWAGGDSGFYIGGSIGESDFESKAKATDNDQAYKLLGGFNFGIIPLIDLAIEASYRDFGSFDSADLDSGGVESFDVFGLAALTFGPLGIFGKAGYAELDADSNLGGSSSNPAYGIGVRFQIGSLSLRGEYEYFDTSSDIRDLAMTSIGLTYTF
jgi:hypothetical protein